MARTRRKRSTRTGRGTCYSLELRKAHQQNRCEKEAEKNQQSKKMRESRIEKKSIPYDAN